MCTVYNYCTGDTVVAVLFLCLFLLCVWVGARSEDLEHAEYIRTLQNMMQTSATLTAAAAENDNDEELERQLMSSEGEEEDAEEYGAMSEQEGSEVGEEAEEDLLAEDAPWMKEGAMDAILGDAEGDDPIPVMRYGEPAEAFHARLRAHQESMLRDPR